MSDVGEAISSRVWEYIYELAERYFQSCKVSDVPPNAEVSLDFGAYSERRCRSTIDWLSGQLQMLVMNTNFGVLAHPEDSLNVRRILKDWKEAIERITEMSYGWCDREWQVYREAIMPTKEEKTGFQKLEPLFAEIEKQQSRHADQFANFQVRSKMAYKCHSMTDRYIQDFRDAVNRIVAEELEQAGISLNTL